MREHKPPKRSKYYCDKKYSCDNREKIINKENTWLVRRSEALKDKTNNEL